jgi:hypothetical protein
MEGQKMLGVSQPSAYLDKQKGLKIALSSSSQISNCLSFGLLNAKRGKSSLTL